MQPDRRALRKPLRKVGENFRQIVGGNQLEDAVPDPLGWCVAYDSLHRGACITDFGVGPDDHDDVTGVLDELLRVLLTCAQRFLGLFALSLNFAR